MSIGFMSWTLSSVPWALGWARIGPGMAKHKIGLQFQVQSLVLSWAFLGQFLVCTGPGLGWPGPVDNSSLSEYYGLMDSIAHSSS